MFAEKYKITNIEVNAYFPLSYPSMLQSPIEFINVEKNMGYPNYIAGFLDGYWSLRFGDKIFRTQDYFTNSYGNVFASQAMKTFLV